jgi:phage-related protein (TIGR01555 family)
MTATIDPPVVVEAVPIQWNEALNYFLQDSLEIRKPDFYMDFYDRPQPTSNHPPEEKPTPSLVGDSAVTTLPGFSSPVDPSLLSIGGSKFISYPLLSELRQNPIIQNIVNTYAEEMTRRWVERKPSEESESDEEVKRLSKLDRQWSGEKIFREAKEISGYYGGCLVFIDNGDTNLEVPMRISPGGIARGSLRGFTIIEPINCYPMGYNTWNPLSLDYYVPQYWNILGQDVHASRFLYFSECSMPVILRPTYNFFGMSTSQLIIDYVYNFERSRDAAARAIRNHSLLGLKTNMGQMLQGDTGDPQNLVNRLRFMQAVRDQDGIAALDKEFEDFFQITTPLAGLSDLTSQQLELLSLITRLPVTKLFGTPPRGFNATGDAEKQDFAHVIAGMQKRQLQDNVRKFDQIIQLNEYGSFLQDIDYVWPDTREMTEEQRAQIRSTEAATDAALVTAQIISGSEARMRLAASTDGGYQNIEVGEVTPPESVSVPGLDLDDDSDTDVGPTSISPEKVAELTKRVKGLGDQALSAFDKGFKESEHPRGQPGNPGQFSEKESGSSSTPSKGKRGSRASASRTDNMAPAPEDIRNWKDRPPHLKGVYIPPAWKNVKYALDPGSKLLVTGYDAKGRKQSVYAKTFSNENKDKKFQRVSKLQSEFDKISGKIANDLNDEAKREVASCMYLVAKMGLRPGSKSNTKADVEARGATTLLGENVAIEGKSVYLRFIGKKGVKIDLEVSDSVLKEMLSDRAKTVGANNKLFSTDEKKLSAYAHSLGSGFKTKDFRTRLGTATAIEITKSMDPPKNKKEYQKLRNMVGDAVSSVLGNTRTVALSAYISPKVFETWEVGVHDSLSHDGWRMSMDAVFDDEGPFDPEDEADMDARQYLDEDDDEYSPLGAAIFREMTGMDIEDEEDEEAE